MKTEVENQIGMLCGTIVFIFILIVVLGISIAKVQNNVIELENQLKEIRNGDRR